MMLDLAIGYQKHKPHKKKIGKLYFSETGNVYPSKEISRKFKKSTHRMGKKYLQIISLIRVLISGL